MRHVILDKIQEWFDSEHYQQAYSLASNLPVDDPVRHVWMQRLEAVGAHIPPHVKMNCDARGMTEPFYQEGDWWGFPKGGVMPVKVFSADVQITRLNDPAGDMPQITSCGVTSRDQADRLSRALLDVDQHRISRAIPWRESEELRSELGLHYDRNTQNTRDTGGLRSSGTRRYAGRITNVSINSAESVYEIGLDVRIPENLWHESRGHWMLHYYMDSDNAPLEAPVHFYDSETNSVTIMANELTPTPIVGGIWLISVGQPPMNVNFSININSDATGFSERLSRIVADAVDAGFKRKTGRSFAEEIIHQRATDPLFLSPKIDGLMGKSWQAKNKFLLSSLCLACCAINVFYSVNVLGLSRLTWLLLGATLALQWRNLRDE